MRTALLLLALLAPLASAAPATFELETSRPTLLSGTFSATMWDAAGEWWGRHSGEFVVDVVRGELRVQTWEDARLDGPLSATQPLARPQDERFPLDGATVRLRLDDDWHAGTLARAASVRILGVAADEGTPHFLATGFASATDTPVRDFVPHADRLDYTWDEGDLFLGAVSLYTGRYEGFPRLDAADVEITGPFLLELVGGNLSVEGDAPLERQLGNHSDSSPLDAARVERWAIATLTVEEGAARASLPAAWGFAADATEETLEGRVVWRHASGNVAGRAVKDAEVVAQGSLALTMEAGGLTRGTTYRGSGDLAFIVVDQETLLGGPRGGLPPALLGAGILGALLLAARVAVAFYTRLPPRALLDHPRRRVLYDVAVEAEGIHLADLHRRVGGAYGAFRFHLRQLVRGGYLRTEKRGRYQVILPASGTSATPSIIVPPVARDVFAALPREGGLTIREIASATGASRQLVDHHLRQLLAQGFVARERQSLRRVKYRRLRDA